MPGEAAPSLGWPGTKNAQGHWVRRVVATPSLAQRVEKSRQLHVVRYRLAAPRSRACARAAMFGMSPKISPDASQL